ncbi:YceI family protein [Mycobacterium kansasii]|uniref:Polyisoprenoid-binding protein n=3 Tax=Mycobacterium kansasii TaxID=1768 RepID=A0A1V3XTC2_MYCKA|nr:YceI family protein [Mycobacterium kansasii]EUA03669.1 yceI-like domain protein [Mycobacterium kansasii 824]AGZ52713.1 hypothetical protein MKAN_22215 [Mycobacterium kansasii ATCC 12478]ARG55624.1 hypothetical protein B1T43_06825 [Mycobacterium kansasii]ARG61071.1 hypothetical protein B1T45_06880 [Mycobacterium kansasii]ARG68770.1 hypothetical protein B1T47_06665 [Mycobacterium kansasii]
MTTLETLLSDPDAAGAWNLVPDRSAVTFKVKNMWGLLAVKGEFTKFVGRGNLTDQGTVSGYLEVDVASLRTGIRLRDKHLLSADFFEVERFPEIRVVVTALHPTKGKHAELQASFTIKGITDPVTLPVTVTEFSDGSVRIAGETEIDRVQFGLRWNKFGILAVTATASGEVCFVKAP